MNEPLTDEEIEKIAKQTERYFDSLPSGDRVLTSTDFALFNIQSLLTTIDQRTKERDEYKKQSYTAIEAMKCVEHNQEVYKKERDELKRKVEELDKVDDELILMTNRHTLRFAECKKLKEENAKLRKGLHAEAHSNAANTLAYHELKEENERLLNKDMAWLKSDVELREENVKLKRKAEELQKHIDDDEALKLVLETTGENLILKEENAKLEEKIKIMTGIDINQTTKELG